MRAAVVTQPRDGGFDETPRAIGDPNPRPSSASHRGARPIFTWSRRHSRARVLRGARARRAVPPSTGRRSVAPVRSRPGPTPCSTTDLASRSLARPSRAVATSPPVANGSEGDVIDDHRPVRRRRRRRRGAGVRRRRAEALGGGRGRLRILGRPLLRERGRRPSLPPASRPSPAASPAPITPTSATSPSRACPSAPTPRPKPSSNLREELRRAAAAKPATFGT